MCLQAGAPQLAFLQQCSEPAQRQVAEAQLQLEAARKELAAERSQAAAARAEDQRIASSHQDLQAAWKGMVDELKEQLEVKCHSCI
jgi:sRNA-binding protein